MVPGDVEVFMQGVAKLEAESGTYDLLSEFLMAWLKEPIAIKHFLGRRRDLAKNFQACGDWNATKFLALLSQTRGSQHDTMGGVSRIKS